MDNLITAIFGFIGVLIGAILTPFITYKIEKIKRKNEIKSSLIKALYVYHSYYKMNLSLANTIRYKMQEANHLQGVFHLSGNEGAKMQHEFLKEDLIRKQENNLGYSEKRMEFAGEIDSLLAQTLQYFGKDKYNAIEKPLNEYLKECQGNKYFYEYLEMDTLPKLQEVVSKVQDKQQEMDKEKNIVAKLILNTL